MSHFLKYICITFICLRVRCEVLQVQQSRNGPRQRNLLVDDPYHRRKAQTFSSSNRHARFLSLFTFVQFSNQECVGATGDVGTCLAPAECSQRGGTANGPCAQGYGTCCLFILSCGSTVFENVTYFTNSGYPQPYDGTGSCQLTVMKSNPDVCQFRLDFDQLTIMNPEPTNHICDNDQFIVSGGNPVPPICGNSAGNHMYVESGLGTTSPLTLSVVTSGPSFSRTWKMRITQIPCSAQYKAPDGCLQYFTGVAGQLKSFNYDPVNGLQLSNQDYAICVRAERNFCGIQYTQCPDTVNNRSQSFTLSGNSNTVVSARVGSTGNNNVCQNDYVIIPMASNVGRPATTFATTVDRICGGTFSADVTVLSTPVRSTLKPFVVWFHSDGIEEPQDIANKGFCLNYVQQPCTNNLS